MTGDRVPFWPSEVEAITALSVYAQAQMSVRAAVRTEDEQAKRYSRAVKALTEAESFFQAGLDRRHAMQTGVYTDVDQMAELDREATLLRGDPGPEEGENP